MFRGYYFFVKDAAYHIKWEEKIDTLMSIASTRFGMLSLEELLRLSSCSSLFQISNYSFARPSQWFHVLFISSPSPSPYSRFLGRYGDVTKEEVIHDSSDVPLVVLNAKPFWYSTPLSCGSLVIERLLP